MFDTLYSIGYKLIKITFIVMPIIRMIQRKSVEEIIRSILISCIVIFIAYLAWRYRTYPLMYLEKFAELWGAYKYGTYKGDNDAKQL